MVHQFPFYLALVVGILLLIMTAKRLHIAYPIVLVVGGLLISFVPGIPHVVIDPNLIFIIFLPPLLYEAAWYTSWKELWRFRRIIGSFAFLIVILTSFVVAWVASGLIPGFTLALGFLLGGIVSPPDAVSATSILRNVKVSRHFRAIIEGESLLNDASSLIVFRFALVAVGTGRFVFQEAALDFFWVIGAGLVVGLIVAGIFYWMHRLLPTDANMDIVLTLVAPYAMYIGAESIHVSGVLAVVAGGLFLSSRSHIIFDNQTRIQGQGVWSALGFILNGLVFMLIGLQLPAVVADLGDTSLSKAIQYGILITVVLIIGRILSAFSASFITRVARKARLIPASSMSPNWRVPLVFGWAGMRGVVSLAAALAIPPLLGNGEPFPQRNLILFITFVVILLTLIIQGLTLPWLIRKLKIADTDSLTRAEEELDRRIQRQLAERSLQYLQQKCSVEVRSHPSIQHLASRWEHAQLMLDDESLQGKYRHAYLKLLNEQRIWLREWNKDFETDEEIIRKHLMRLDLEEAKLKLS